MNDEIITSYLLGKKAGGGGTPPVYQDKEVSITQNGETTITKDEGYDALSSVELTVAVPEPSGTINITQNGETNVKNYETANVNVPQPSGKITITQNGTDIDVSSYATADVSVGGGTVPNSFEDFQTALHDFFDDFITYINETEINNRTAYVQSNITLYTPDSACKYYVIRKKNNGKYGAVWCEIKTIEYFKNNNYYDYRGINSSTGSLMIKTSGITKTYPKIETYSVNLTNQVYFGGDFDTAEEVITALQNNTITYSTTSNNLFNLGSPKPFIYSNASIIEFSDNKLTTYIGASVISHNETIITA